MSFFGGDNGPSTSSSLWVLMQKGMFGKYALDNQPDIQTFTLCRCHPLNKEQDNLHHPYGLDEMIMKRALQILLDKYPILLGRACKHKGQYWVQKSYFPCSLVSSLSPSGKLGSSDNHHHEQKDCGDSRSNFNAGSFFQFVDLSSDADFQQRFENLFPSLESTTTIGTNTTTPTKNVETEQELDSEPHPSSSSSMTMELWHLLDEHIIPLHSPIRTVAERVSKKLPLVQVSFILLPHGFYCYSFSMSHLLGDATTYYQLLHEYTTIISSLLLVSAEEEEQPEPKPEQPAIPSVKTSLPSSLSRVASLPWSFLDWTHPLFPTHELSEHPRDVVSVTGWPIAFGFLRQWWRHSGRHAQRRFYVVPIDQDLIKKEKEKLKQQQESVNRDAVESRPSFVSTNDILTAAICKALCQEKQDRDMHQTDNKVPTNNESAYELLLMSRNDRKRTDTVSSHHAGNFFSVVGIPVNHVAQKEKEGVTAAHTCRKIVHQGFHYPPGELPRRPLYQGKHVMMTNWATARGGLSIQILGEVPSSLSAATSQIPRHELVAHTPHPSFIRSLPLANVMVSYFNDHTQLVMHNITTLTSSDTFAGLSDPRDLHR